MTSSLRFDQFIHKSSPSLEISSLSNNLKTPSFVFKNEVNDEIEKTINESPKGKKSHLIQKKKQLNEASEDIRNIVSYSNHSINKFPKTDDNEKNQKEMKKIDLNDVFKNTIKIQDLEHHSKPLKIANALIRNSSDGNSSSKIDNAVAISLIPTNSSAEDLFKLLAIAPESLPPQKKIPSDIPTNDNNLRKTKNEVTLVEDQVLSIQSSEDDGLFSISGFMPEELPLVNKPRIRSMKYEKLNKNSKDPHLLISKNTFNKLDPPVPSIKVKRVEILSRSTENAGDLKKKIIKTTTPRAKSPQYHRGTSSYLKDDFESSTISSRELIQKVVTVTKNKLNGHKLTKSAYPSEVLYNYPQDVQLSSSNTSEAVVPTSHVAYDDSLGSLGESENIVFEDEIIKSSRDNNNNNINNNNDDDMMSEIDILSQKGYLTSKLPPVSPIDNQDVNYKVHRRIQGWKLTNPRRRQDLVNMLDTIHNVNPKESLSNFSKFLLDDNEKNPYNNNSPTNQLMISDKKGSIIKKRIRKVPPLSNLNLRIQAIDETRLLSPPIEPIYFMEEINSNIEEESFDDNINKNELQQSTDFNFKILNSPQHIVKEQNTFRQSRAWVKEVNRILKVRHTYSNALGIKILAEEKIKKKKKMEIAEADYKMKHSLFMESFDNSDFNNNNNNDFSYMRPLERNVVTPTIVSSRMQKFNNDSPENTRAKTPLIDSNNNNSGILDRPDSRARTPISRVASARIDNHNNNSNNNSRVSSPIIRRELISSPNNNNRGRSKSPHRKSDLQDIYDYPTNMNRSLERMDIIENVNNRVVMEYKDQEIQNKNKLSQEIIN